MLLDELATRLGTVSGLTYPIRVGVMPNDVVECLVIREVPGLGAELGFGKVGIYLEHPLITVEVRCPVEDYATGRAQLELAFQDLPKVQATELSGTLYHHIIPRQAPYLAYTDEKKRPVLAFTADVTKVPS